MNFARVNGFNTLMSHWLPTNIEAAKKCGKEIRLDAVEIEGNHAAHGLAGGVNAVGVNRFLGHQAFDEAQGHADFVRGLPLVVYRRFGVRQHKHEGRVFCLRFVGCPNNAAVALHQRGFHAFACGAGVGNEHHQRVFAAGLKIFRRVQVVLHFFARLQVFEGQHFKTRGDLLAQGEQAAVVGFIRAAVLLVPSRILCALGGGAVFSGVLRGGTACVK